MKIVVSRNFEKKYQKLRDSEKEKFKKRRNTFLINQFDPILNNHALKGKYQGYRSINITGDLRVLYELLDEDTAHFILIDTHSNLYK